MLLCKDAILSGFILFCSGLDGIYQSCIDPSLRSLDALDELLGGSRSHPAWWGLGPHKHGHEGANSPLGRLCGIEVTDDGDWHLLHIALVLHGQLHNGSTHTLHLFHLNTKKTI